MPDTKPSPSNVETNATSAETKPALVKIETPPQRPEGAQKHDHIEAGSVFVRACPKCDRKHQTTDGSGKRPCRECEPAMLAEAAKAKDEKPPVVVQGSRA